MAVDAVQHQVQGQMVRVSGVDQLTSVIDGDISRVRVFDDGLNLHLFTQVRIYKI